ncbi:MAG: hypothetical protein V1660_01830 [archaeon]
MAQVDKSSVHVQILNEEAVDSKKAALELQLLTLNSMRNLLTIKELRKLEFDAKRQARTKFQEISKLIKEIKELLPVLKDMDLVQGMEGYDLPEGKELQEMEEPQSEPKTEETQEKPSNKRIVKEKKPPKIKKDKKTRLDEELQEIKSKLQSLQ